MPRSEDTRALALELETQRRLTADLASKLLQTRTRLDVVTRDRERLRAERDDLAARLESSESTQTGALRRENEELHTRVHELQLALQEMRASTSWHVTSPLRAAVSTARRLRGG